jgi:putative PIN family toxin of toxin-antitoxin system
VLDANVLVSAAIRTGPSHRIVQRWLRDATFDVIACPTLLAEVRDVLTGRPRLRRWIDLDVAEDFCATVETYATVVADPAEIAPTVRDADDDYLVALAKTNNVDYLVTGDQDLVDWDAASAIVITPAQFEQQLAG